MHLSSLSDSFQPSQWFSYLYKQSSLPRQVLYCDELKTPPGKLPYEIMLKIFSCLNFDDQKSVSKVCRRWNVIVKDKTLKYGQLTYMNKFGLVEHKLFEIDIHPSCYEAANKNFIFLRQGQTQGDLIIIVKKSQKIIRCLVKDALGNVGRQQHNLIWNHLRSVIPISDSNFITAYDKGTIIRWKIENENLICEKRIQIFDPSINEIILSEVIIHLNHLYIYIHTRVDQNSSRSDYIFDLNMNPIDDVILKKKSPYLYDCSVWTAGKHAVLNDKIYEVVHAGFKSTRMSFINKYCLLTTEFDENNSVTYKEDKLSDYASSTSIAAANNKWVIIYRGYQGTDDREFMAYDTKTMKGKLLCRFNFSVVPIPPLFPGNVLLQDDYLIIVLKDEVGIWYVPSQSRLTSIPRESVPNDSWEAFNLKFENNEVRVLMHNSNTTKIKEVVYRMNTSLTIQQNKNFLFMQSMNYLLSLITLSVFYHFSLIRSFFSRLSQHR